MKNKLKNKEKEKRKANNKVVELKQHNNNSVNLNQLDKKDWTISCLWENHFKFKNT